jgi:sugar porter (SP) family MFS transporter
MANNDSCKAAPLYISEISPPELRGTLLVLESISIVSGVVIAFWITYGTQYLTSEASFRLPFALQMVCATILGVGIHFFPYSPRWLALVGRRNECLSSLSKLRKLPPTDERVQTEYKGIITEVEFQRLVIEKTHPGVTGFRLEVNSWLELFRRRNWHRTAVGCGILFFQQFSGINAFIYYAPTLFKNLGQTDHMSLIMSGIFNILQLLAVIICFLIIDKVGRRPLAIFGAIGNTICYVVITILSGLYSHDWPAHQGAGWATVAMVFCFILVYGVSYSPLGWALPSEVFSTATRSKGVALSVCVNWLSNFIVAIAVPPMMEYRGYQTYIFFTVMCLLAAIWAFLLVPETKGKTLEEIDEVFGGVQGQEEQAIMRQAIISVNEEIV